MLYWKLLDIRVGRANRYQFIVVVAMIAASLYALTEYVPYNQYIVLYHFTFVLQGYLFILIAWRRHRDMIAIYLPDLPMIWDPYVLFAKFALPDRFKNLAYFVGDSFPYENRYGMPPKGINFFSMVTEGFPLSDEELANRVRTTYKYQGKAIPNAHEPTDAPVRALSVNLHETIDAPVRK